MPTPPEWGETLQKVREMVLDVIGGRSCIHSGDRYYTMEGSTPWHAVISAYCSNCKKYLGSMG